jgi:hypothetical protein
MNYLLKAFSRLLSGAVIVGSLLLTAGVAYARTNDLYVDSVTMDDLKNIELNPGDPIRYTVSYGREVATGTDKHGEQRVRVSVYLSTDGDPENKNNFLLDFFDDLFPKDATAEDPRSFILTDRLPPNFTGTYFLLAKIRVTNGSADSYASDDIPAVNITAAARVTIRPYDSATVSRISTSATGTESNELSESPSVTSDGRYVVFQSEATNLVSSPTAPAGISQIYLRDTLTNEVKLISQLGGVAGNGESKFPVISSLGSDDPIAGSPRYYIAYQSAASNLVSGTGATDTNQQTDIFLYDLANATTTLISVPTGAPAGQLGNGGSFLPSISGDGNLIAFESLASNLLGKRANGAFLDTNGKSDVYVYNRSSKVVTAASATLAGVLGNGDSTQARISENGSTVVFRSFAGNLAVGAAAPLPRSEILAKTLVSNSSTGRLDRISVIREASGAATRSFTALNRDAFDPAVSSDGRYVAFATRATNTTAPNGDTNDAGLSQVYVVNRAVDATPGAVLNPALDYDKVGNVSLNLVSTGISPLNPLPGFADDESVAPAISGDGRYIGFRTEASDLQPTTVLRSDGRVFQTKSSGVIAVFPDNTDVTIDMPVVTIKDGGGTGATAHAIVLNGRITSIVVDSAGSGYSATADPKLTVEITGGGGNGAQATATIGTVDGVTDAISGITLTRSGRGYASAEVVFTNGVGAGATGVASLSTSGGVKDVSILTNGFGYNPQYTQIDFSDPDAPGGGVKPEAVPVIENGKIYDIAILSQGSGYLTAPTVSILSTPLVAATAQATFEKGIISSVDVLNTGAGYVSSPDVSIDVTDSAGTTSYPATALISDGLTENAINSYSDSNSSSDVYIRDTGLKSIIVTEGGTGYTENILLDSTAIKGGGGSSASALAIVEDGMITRIDLLNSGSGYLSAPTITLPDSPTGGVKATASAILTEGSERVSLSQYGQETIGLIGGFEVPSSRSITMSSNGRYMLFTSEASNNAGFIFGKSNQFPLDQNKKRDIFIVDRKISQAVTPVRGTAPTVTISIDTRDLTFNSSRVISATAFDGGDVTLSGDEQLPKDGVIKSIEIYANNLKIASNSGVGTASTMLLDAVYTAPRVAGPTQIYAVTTDGNGNRVYSTPQIINVVAPQTQRPSVTLSSSTSTLTVGGTFVLSAIATDPENSIYSVSFYSNGLLLFTDPLPPYQYSYTPTYSGEYKLTAIVSDNDPLLLPGQAGSQVRNDSISNEIVLRVLPPPSPTINISSPSEPVTAASLGQPVFLELNATTTNPSASISSVQIKDNGKLLAGIAQRQGLTASYRYTWYPTTTGLHTITAVATDSQQGTSESSSRDFTVSAIIGSAPVVDIISPAADALPILTQDIVNFQVRASDLGGTIRSTVIYGNGARLGSATFNTVSGYWELPVDASLLATGLYDFVAVSTDNDGNLVASPVRSLSVVISAPVVSILTPALASGVTVVDTKVDQPLLFIVRAYTRDSFSRVSNVTLSSNGTSIGQATRIGNTDQYSFTWLPTTTGVFQIVASASDTKGGGSQTAELNIRVTELVGTAPEVQVSAPASASIGSQVLFVANATDNTGVSSVNFYADGVSIGAATRQGTTNQWVLNATLSGAPFSAKGVGSYAITAIASDADRNQTQSAVVNLDVTAAVAGTAPSGSLASPQEGSVQIVGQSVPLRALVTDADGAIASVRFYANGVLVDTVRNTPFTGSWTPTVAGSYNLVLVITDAQGATTVTSPVAVTVVKSTATAPTVEIVSPVVGTTAVAGQDTTLEASVTVGTGATVNQLNFYANGIFIGSGARQGQLDRYRFVWQPSVTGSFQLTAEVVDSFGTSGETTSPRLITVIAQSGALPFVEIIQPVPPATTNGGTPASLTATANSDLNLAASAVDSDGTVSSVEFFLDRGRPAVATATVTFPSVVVNGAALQQSTGYISSIAFTDAGTGYLSPPVVTIVGDGVGATAEAEIQNGAISRIRVTNRGSGYTNAFVRMVGGGLVENLSIGFAVRDFSSDVWRLATPFNFKSYGAGFYTFRAVAKDNNNNVQRSTAVSVTVSPAPLTTPVTGNVVSTPSTANVDGQRVPAGQTVQLSLTPSVVGGTVASVEFFANGESVGSDTAAPFVVNWVPSYVGSYNVIAVVTDSVGNQGVSPALPVYVGGNIAPTINLVRPGLTGSTGVVNQVVLLEAEASALTPGASVSTVEFNADGESVGIASQVGTSNRFVLSTWRPASAKIFSITARVVDSFGQAVLTPARTITVQTQTGVIPTVVLTAPSPSGTSNNTNDPFAPAGITGGTRISNNSALFLSAQANDADGSVSKVEFLLSRGQQATASAKLQYSGGGVISITVGSGGTSTSTSSGSGYLYAPRVKIVGNGVGATAEAIVTNGSVTSIRVLSSGSGYTFTPQVVIEGGGLYENLVVGTAINAPGTLTWSTSLDLRNYDVGPYFVSARVTDNQGNTSISSTSAVTVTQATASAPVVTLSAPTPASIDLGLTSNLVAIATSAVGVNITKVDFYANGTLVSTAPLAPYLLAFTAPSAGSYEIYAIVTDSAGNATLSQARTLVVKGLAPDATLANIDRAYQALLDRSSTSAETKSALARNGVNLTSGQVAELILQSSDYRDNQAKLILSHYAVWGTYPNNSDYADLQAKKLALTLPTDAGLIDAILASASYKQLYGDIADLSTTNPTQYNRVRDFAVRIYTNLYGKAPAKAATTNTVAKQFFTTISTGGSAGQAVVNFINANFGTVSKATVTSVDTTGGAVTAVTNLQPNATLLARLRVAGAILLIGNEQPTAAQINALSGLSLAAVADYYFEGDTPFAAGTMVSIETATESVAGTTYYASGLPKGLTMDRTTGVISGRLPSVVKGYAITYWSQNKGVRSASTTRILLVEALEAKFIGASEALLVDGDGLPAGKLTVKVAGTADYTGTLVYRDGATYSFKGVLSVVFDEDGVSTAFGEQAPIKRKAPLTTLDIGLFFDIDGALSTSVTEGDDVAPVAAGDAIRVFNFTKAAPAPWQGSYKVGLLDVSDTPYYPDTAGSGTLTVANTGVLSVALVGKDGAKITGSVSGSVASDYRLYIRPYAKKPLGYFAGAIRFSDEATPSEVDFPMIGNDLTWLRPAGLAPITNGFGPLKIELDYAPPAL